MTIHPIVQQSIDSYLNTRNFLTFQNFLSVLSAFLFYSMIFWGLKNLSEPILRFPDAFAFSSTLLIVLLLHRYISTKTDKFLKTHFPFYKDLYITQLEDLHDKLDSSLGYQEITKIIFKTFESLLPNTPQVFYIWENNMYYLVRGLYVEQGSNLPETIDAVYLKDISPAMDRINIDREIILPGKDIKAFKKAGFSVMVPFFGHNQVFAFLLTRKRNPLLTRKSAHELLIAIQHKAGLILENSGLFIDLEKKNFEIRKLIEVSQRVLSSLDIKEILDFILDALGTLIRFDAAAIFLLDKSGANLVSMSSRGYDQDVTANLYLKVGQGACGYVAQTKKIDVINDVSESSHYYRARSQTRSQISVPLLFDGNLLGVICAESDQTGYFHQNEVEIARIFANQAAIAIHNARQVEIRLAKQALEHELIHAGSVQQSLLIKQFPRLKHLHLLAENIPSKEVSGDLYDFIKLDEKSVGFVIGDVSGKGTPAALMMALILAGFRTQNKSVSTTCDVVNRLNTLLTHTTIEGKYTTFFYGIIRMDIHKIIYTNAGHNPPLLIKKDGSVHELFKGGIVLGFMDSQQYTQGEFDFEKGDLLVAYTDGITEAMNGHDEEFGEERLTEILRNNRDKSIHEIKQEIINALKKFSHFETQDDITLIIASHE